MMDFSFSEEQKLLIKTIRGFSRKELAPYYAQWDQRGEFPRELFRKMGDLGLPGVLIPQEYGGMGADHVTAGLVLEEVARGDYSCSQTLVNTCLGSSILLSAGTEEQKRRWLPHLARGDMTVAICLTEPDAGSDAAAIKTRALRRGKGYILGGEKSSITLAGCAELLMVWAKTNPSLGARGVTAFIVPGSTTGVTRRVYRDLGARAILRGSLYLDEVEVPEENRLGEEGRGFHLVMGSFDFSRALIGLMCLGTAQAALEDAMDYAKKRYAFGQPIARFEGVSFAIAEHATYLQAARLLCYQTLWLRDKGLPHTKEAAMCKWWAPKASVDAIHASLLIHGQFGYNEDFPQAQRLRDVLGSEIGDGTAEIQKMVIARELLGREYLPYQRPAGGLDG